MSAKTIANLGALLITFIWSGWIILSRSGVQTNLTPEDITMIRFGTATIFALPFSLRYDWKSLTLWKATVVALGCGFPYTMLSFYGLMEIKAANAGVIVNGLLPVFGLILSYLVLQQKTTPLKLLAVGLIVLANVIMIGNPGVVVDNWSGWLMLILASLVFSLYMFLGKRWNYTTKDVLAFLPLINAALFLPWWLMSASGIPDTTLEQIILQAGYQGILVSIVALLITFYAIKHIGAMSLSIYFAFVPFITSLLAWYILDEHLSNNEIIGILICSIGLYLFAKRKTLK